MPVAGGGFLRQRYLPLQRAGICVPGGAAAYPSTVLMTAVPAQAAGVRRALRDPLQARTVAVRRVYDVQQPIFDEPELTEVSALGSFDRRLAEFVGLA